MTDLVADARAHAIKASALLDSLDALSEKVENFTDDQRFQMALNDGYARLNKDMEWTATLAAAHALVAIALDRTEPT